MTARTAAARYARALFDVVLQEGSIETVQAELQQFADIVAQHHQLATALNNPSLPSDRRVALVKALLEKGGGVSLPLAKLLALMAARDRMALLPDLAVTYRERVLDHQQIVRGEVTSATPLPAEKIRALEASLGQATGRKVMLDATVDPSIIGGVITRLGSTVYDGSVTTQLEKMKQALVEAGQ